MFNLIYANFTYECVILILFHNVCNLQQKNIAENENHLLVYANFKLWEL